MHLGNAMYRVLFAVLLCTPAAAQSAYDESWHRAPFWSGEYPGGFSVVEATTVMLRPSLDPAAERSIACELPERATYQMWNHDRAEEQGLAFVSYTRIADYTIMEAFETSLYRNPDGTEDQISFKPGDTWRYLVYFAEGTFLMEFNGVRYDGNQDLFDVSAQVGDASGYEEWLRINCPNNQWGWLFMGDISLDDGSFIGPNITEYGTATDLD
jgi:hypothetical protein